MYWGIWHAHTTHAALNLLPAWMVRSKQFLISRGEQRLQSFMPWHAQTCVP